MVSHTGQEETGGPGPAIAKALRALGAGRGLGGFPYGLEARAGAGTLI